MSALEEAARAACREWYATDLNEPQLTKVVETSWDEFASIARAVLMAVRNESKSVALKVYGDQDVEKEVDDFHAMIDQILSDDR